MASTIPDYNQQISQIDVEADAGDIQKGYFKKPGFFGDMSKSQAYSIFTTGVNTALSYAGNASLKNETVPERNNQTGYRLTTSEMILLRKKALSISNYSKIPYDTVEDFLVILCFVDVIHDMKKIADCVQIPELANPAILRKPLEILEIRGLEKISFAANALDGLVNLYRKYLNAAQNTINKDKGDSAQSILSAISSIIGGFGGGGVGPRLETSDLGNFLSELITGERIPTNVIAKNPMMQSPSYTGKAFFGEAPNAMSNVDIDQLFAKKIAVFAQPSSGAGTSAFSMQNFGSFSGSMSLPSFVSKIVTGSSNPGSTRKQNLINSLVEGINTFTGSTSSDLVEVTRADNAIPVMMALATQFSGYEKSVFSGSTFQEGWMLAQSVGNNLQIQDPKFIEAARKFL